MFGVEIKKIDDSEHRFTKIHRDTGKTEETSIFKDNETGVLYFMVTRGGNSGIGLTPLLDPNGKPIVDPVE